jgi:hypothetical protein
MLIKAATNTVPTIVDATSTSTSVNPERRVFFGVDIHSSVKWVFHVIIIPAHVAFSE